MSTPDVNKAQFGTGQLAYGCTNLSLAFPHGGTALGLVGRTILKPQTRYAVGVEEEGSYGRVFKLGGLVLAAIELLEWNNDANTLLFQQTATSGSDKIVKLSRASYGSEVSALTNVVFTAHDPAHVSWVLYNCRPAMTLDAELEFSAYNFLRLPAFLYARNRTSDEEVGEIGPLSLLTAL